MTREELRFILFSLLFDFEMATHTDTKLAIAIKIERVEIELNDMSYRRRSS